MILREEYQYFLRVWNQPFSEEFLTPSIFNIFIQVWFLV